MSTTIKPLAPTLDEIAFAEASGIRYQKSKKKEFEKLRNLALPSLEYVNEFFFQFGGAPEDYKIFLLEKNGGKPEPSAYKSKSNSYYILSQLFALGGKKNSIYPTVENQLSTYIDVIPELSIPIGDSPGGDLFLLSLNSKNFGEIFYRRHDIEMKFKKKSSYDDLELICTSFSDLFNNLQ